MSSPSPASVGNKFVVSYFTHMNQNPQSLQNFYEENSVFTHGSERTFGSSEETVFGIEEINKKIENLDFRDAKVTLSVVDCQASNNGVIVLVVGHLSNKGESSRKFVQTFFLTEQQKGVYFVLNNVFRYLDGGRTPDTPAPVPELARVEEPARPSVQELRETESKPKETKSAQITATIPEPNPAPPKENPHTAESHPTKATVSPAVKPSIPTQPPSSSTYVPKKETSNPPAPTKKVEAPPEEKPVPTGPKSWSNVAGSVSSQPSESTANVPIQHPVKRTTPPPTQPVVQKAPPRKEEKVSGATSLFVSNVPFNVTEDQIKASFNKFGQIIEVSIIPNKGYVFLELATLEAAQKAIQSGKEGGLIIDGRTISVEERKPKKDGPKERRSDDRGTRERRGPRNDDERRGPRNDDERRGPRNDDKRSPSNGKPTRGISTDKRS